MIDLLIPTRGRPERLKQAVKSALDNCTTEVRVFIYVDEDDHSIMKGGFPFYLKMEERVWIKQSKRLILSECWNDLYNGSQYVNESIGRSGNEDILFHGSDDIIFETKDWDKVVIEHFQKHPESLLYGRDGHQDKNCPTHSFTSRSAADKIGYFVPPYFEADFNDVWLREVYTKANRIFYNPDLMIRHNHVNVDKKYDDATYQLAVERRVRAAKVWEEKKHLIDEDVKKLLA